MWRCARRRWRTSLAKIDQWMEGTVWTTRCSNYFRAANGRVVTQWPRSARAFWGMTRRFNPPTTRSRRHRQTTGGAAGPARLMNERLDPVAARRRDDAHRPD